jgi:hypothetical protein
MDYWAGRNSADTLNVYNESYLIGVPEFTHLRYEAGTMYVHDGLKPHRIANCGDMVDGEHRITIQGHGVTLSNGVTAIYF